MIPDQDYIWQLLARCFSNEISEEEYAELEKLISSDDHLKEVVQILNDFWQTTKKRDTVLLEDVWNKHVDRLDKSSGSPLN